MEILSKKKKKINHITCVAAVTCYKKMQMSSSIGGADAIPPAPNISSY